MRLKMYVNIYCLPGKRTLVEEMNNFRRYKLIRDIRRRKMLI